MDRATISLLSVITALALVAALIVFGQGRSKAAETNLELLAPDSLVKGGDSPVKPNTDSSHVYVRVIGPDGKLTPIVRQEMIVKSDADWQAMLTPEQYRIARNKGTEPAFCGGLLKNKEAGVYTCICCGLPLFQSNAKFESGTGWPSFFQPIAETNIREKTDASHGMVRTEILCTRCDAHLGHVFEDGPRPTGLRYCLNSESLSFVPEGELVSVGEKVEPANIATAVFAGGCFWCVEAVFEEIDGVIDAVSGYAGGTAETADYKAVSTGKTGHAEVVEIIYDADKVQFEDLLRVHFATHDPTTLNRQGNDVGTQYRSAIFYANEEEKKIAEAFIADLGTAKAFASPIVTTLEPLDQFYRAEEYHQNYVCRNPTNSYVRAVALPKVDKLRKALDGGANTK